MTLLSKIKNKYKPVIPMTQLPYSIYKATISSVVLLGISFIFMLVAFLISFEILFLVVGLPLCFIFAVLFLSWIKDFLYGKILVVDGVITEFSNTEKDKQNLLQRKIVSRYVRSTFTLKLLDNTYLQVVCPNNMRYKVGDSLRLYYTQDHLISNNGAFMLNQVSHMEKI